MHTTGRCRLSKDTAKMKMFLKIKFINLNMYIKNKKAGTFQTIMWVAFYVALAVVVFLAMNKAGVFTNQTFTAIKEKFFPFG